MFLKGIFLCAVFSVSTANPLRFRPNDLLNPWTLLPNDARHSLSMTYTSRNEKVPNITEIITRNGYPCEDYDVTTSDGYILSVQRIPHGRGNGMQSGARPAVLVVHGLLGLSTDFVSNLANESLAFILADSGYDVWLGNCRGNTYARRHVHLNPDQEKFWDYTWDDMALSDLPAMVNLVTSKTGQPKIHYVGYSEGTMMGFAGFSKNQTLGTQIKAFYAMGPVTTLTHMTSPLRHLAPFSKEIGFLLQLFGNGEFLPRDTFFDWIAKYGCTEMLTKEACTNFLFLICGTDLSNFNMTRLPFYLTYIPAGTSSKNMIHFAQLYNAKKFQMFDYGSDDENKKHYNQPTPPEYHPEDIQVPVALFWGDKDKLADSEDVKGLIPKLKHILAAIEIPIFEHLDFIWAENAVTPVYSPMIKLMKQVDQGK